MYARDITQVGASSLDHHAVKAARSDSARPFDRVGQRFIMRRPRQQPLATQTAASIAMRPATLYFRCPVVRSVGSASVPNARGELGMDAVGPKGGLTNGKGRRAFARERSGYLEG